MNDNGSLDGGTGGPVDDALFLALVGNLQITTFVHLGKLADPGAGEPVRNLPAAKVSIDMLQMLRTKTNGNLSDAESRFLDHVIFELQMNYVDESSTPEPAPESPQTPVEPTEEQGAPPGDDADQE
ncbi:DUF1844 domain-containing protein [Candidatus Fermentibacteria bacterium]|nr:DUF1844 domain-containing protein [Candidatus Fermentibacteria bacterium]